MWINIKRTTVDRIQNQLIQRTEGTPGVLNSGNIDSALNSPNASFGGQDLYPTDLYKCCKLYHALVSNHGYVDGNKRIGLFMFLVSLDNCDIDAPNLDADLLESTTLQIASGQIDLNQLYDIMSKKLL